MAAAYRWGQGMLSRTDACSAHLVLHVCSSQLPTVLVNTVTAVTAPTTTAAAVLLLPCLQAACLLSACSLNDVLTGITFCGQDNNDVAAVAYDADALVMWRAGCA